MDQNHTRPFRRLPSERGASLVEMLTSTVLTATLLAAGGALFRPAVDISYLLSQQAGMQQSARLASEVVTSRLALAGDGLPGGGIQLPSGTATSPQFACDSSGCYVTSNTFVNNRLYAVTPGDSKGATVNGVATDVITFAYRDPGSDLDQYPLVEISSSGNQVRFDGATSPAYDDAAVGLKVGDVLLLCNANGCAAGTVTNVGTSGYVDLGSDPLDYNQSSAPYGNIKSILTTGVETRAYRILVVTYYIDNSNPDVPRLMQQVSGRSPQVASLFVENLQFSYDIYDEDTSLVTANLADAGGAPNQIRKINISIGARSPVEGLFDRGYQRIVLTTSVSTRSLRFRDFY